MKNNSGIYPSGNKILVKPDKVDEFTDGGIYVPEEVQDKIQMSAFYGYVVALGADFSIHTVSVKERFMDNKWVPVERERIGYMEPFAKVGDRIAFAMYAGKTMKGADGEDYKIMNDQDIMATAEEDVIQESFEARKPLGAG